MNSLSPPSSSNLTNLEFILQQNSTLIVIVGGQYGDEGKGKILAWVSKLILANDLDLVGIRSSGSCNAGHQIWEGDQRYCLSGTPSTIIFPKSHSIIAPGCLVSVQRVAEEIEKIEKQTGINFAQEDDHLVIHKDCHLTFPFHQYLEKKLEEDKDPNKKVGTTGSGVCTTMAAMVLRCGIQVHHMKDEETLRKKYDESIRVFIKDEEVIAQYPLTKELIEQCQKIYRFCKTSRHLEALSTTGKGVYIVEGSQSVQLSLLSGAPPHTTSTLTNYGGLIAGLVGYPKTRYNICFLVLKMFQTKVGGGTLLTKCDEPLEAVFQELGHEFGSVTGRRRSVGFFDIPQLLKVLKECPEKTVLILNKIDIIPDAYKQVGLSTLKICIGMMDSETGQMFTEYPTTYEDIKRAVPIYQEFPVPTDDFTKIKTYDDFSPEFKNIFEFIENKTGKRIGLFGVGKDTDAIIYNNNAF